MTKQNVMTRGFNDLCADSSVAAKFAMKALANISENEPSMIVGKPGAEDIHFEDESRTLVYPVPATLPKLYCCLNETGGATLMLASEY